ncbi:UNVERIFIED_CONTAM: hypothetical protein GTU68_048752, partial [Idotea baltica]|nr:hypothetical protein [Idotea baltica]
MPELPEVETTCRGIQEHICNNTINAVEVREWQLRYLIPKNIKNKLIGRRIADVERRAKYILIRLKDQALDGIESQTSGLLIHLGMSGSLRIVHGKQIDEIKKHDHVDITLSNNKVLRYHDPRKFGLILWADDLDKHKLFAHLGPEPLDEAFNAQLLHTKSRKRRVAVKPFIMDQKIVVGVGNIYASEALFKSGISPQLAANKISLKRYAVLVENIKIILSNAIQQGGTTLRDFVNGDGQPGYFQQQLMVYGRGGEPCVHCACILKEVRLGQR